MSSRPKWRTEPIEVQTRLAQIGPALTVTVLHEAIVQGEMGRAACGANHPPLAGAYTAWADTTAALRDQLLPAGWEKTDRKNFSLTISPDQAHAILVATGDEQTGSPVAEPKTRSRKGPRTKEAVNANLVQLSLFSLVEDEEIRDALVARHADREDALTWVLLVHRTDAGIQAELSLPVGLDEDGRPQTWPERLILPFLPFNDDGSAERRTPAPEPGPTFDIEITRRSA